MTHAKKNQLKQENIFLTYGLEILGHLRWHCSGFMGRPCILEGVLEQSSNCNGGREAEQSQGWVGKQSSHMKESNYKRMDVLTCHFTIHTLKCQGITHI